MSTWILNCVILMPGDDGRWLKHVAYSAGFNKLVLSDVNI